MVLCKHAHATTESSHETRNKIPKVPWGNCLSLLLVSYLLGSSAIRQKIVEVTLARSELSSSLYKDVFAPSNVNMYTM